MRHQKEREKWNNVVKIIDESFEGDRKHKHEAEEIYVSRKSHLRKLKSASNILSSIAVLKEGNEECKTSHFDLVNEEVSLFYPLESPAILGYSLDGLNCRKIFPISITSLINKNIARDRSNPKNSKEALDEIQRFLKNFCSSYNLTVSRVDLNKGTGVFNFETIQRDNLYGSVKQYMTVVLDKNKQFQLNTIKDNVGKLSMDYRSLLSFFTLFGFGEIYAKCTCRNYLSKYTKKRGQQNYYCPHLLYSMSMFPYYLVALLSA